jgi:hypothetical protein
MRRKSCESTSTQIAQEHERGRRMQRAAEGTRARPRHVEAEQPGGEQRVRTAVERPQRDDVLPVGSRREEAGRYRRHPGAEGDGCLGSLELRQGALEATDRRVVQACIDRLRLGQVTVLERLERLLRGVEIVQWVRGGKVERRSVHP